MIRASGCCRSSIMERVVDSFPTAMADLDARIASGAQPKFGLVSFGPQCPPVSPEKNFP